MYHSGAMVHHIYDYNTLRKANVGSTIELLKLASTGKKKIYNFISTLGVASTRDREGKILEVDTTDNPISSNGYVLGKWVCEKILSRAADKGLNINIFRPGNITGDSVNGICPGDKNHALLLMKSCIQMKAAPEWKREIEMMPVDNLSSAIIKLSMESSGFNIYNMNNPLCLTWNQYVDKIRNFGFDLNLYTYEKWKENHLKKINESNALFPLKEFYLEGRDEIIVDREWKGFNKYNSQETKNILEKSGFKYLEDYDVYFDKVLNYLVNSGFIEVSFLKKEKIAY
jgi:thioester reductase-like protein